MHKSENVTGCCWLVLSYQANTLVAEINSISLTKQQGVTSKMAAPPSVRLPHREADGDTATLVYKTPKMSSPFIYKLAICAA